MALLFTNVFFLVGMIGDQLVEQSSTNPEVSGLWYGLAAVQHQFQGIK